jgi:hypothetical protein
MPEIHHSRRRRRQNIVLDTRIKHCFGSGRMQHGPSHLLGGHFVYKRFFRFSHLIVFAKGNRGLKWLFALVEFGPRIAVLMSKGRVNSVGELRVLKFHDGFQQFPFQGLVNMGIGFLEKLVIGLKTSTSKSSLSWFEMVGSWTALDNPCAAASKSTSMVTGSTPCICMDGKF